MRHIKTLLAAAALLSLAACGTNNSFPEPTITNVTPAEVAPGTEITITGSNYYAITGASSTRIEVCGVTMSGTIVEPLTRSILLPPGSTITAKVGTTITSSLPEEGITEGRSDVRVTRPDGSTATLENAVTCMIPTEEPEPELPVAPSITSFTAPGTALTNHAITLTWEINNPDNSNLTCTINPGGEADPITLEDCSSSEIEITYQESGEFIAILTVTDEHAQGDTASLDIAVTNPAAPVITSFTGPETVLVNEVITLAWAVDYDGTDDLMCTITSSEGGTPVDVSADCMTGGTSFTHGIAGPVTLTLSVSDESGNTVTETLTVQVNNALAPEITLFAVTSPNVIGDTVTVSWTISNPQGDPLNCSFHSGIDGAPVVKVSDCNDRNGLFSGYPTAGEFTATLTVRDEHNNAVTQSTTVVVNNPPAPAINSFTSNFPAGTPAEVNEPVTFEWNISIHPNDAVNMTCVIDFGNSDTHDALCQTNSTFTHAFSTHGEHTVTFTVTDEYGGSDTATTTLEVIDSAAPTGTLAGPTTVDANAEADFTWHVSYDGLDDLTCSFNPGDGSATTTLSDCSAGSTTHSYEFAGDYPATLTVQDETNPPVNLTHDITVNATAPAPVIDRWEFAGLLYNFPQGQAITVHSLMKGHKTDPGTVVTCLVDRGNNDERAILADACASGTLSNLYMRYDFGLGKYDATLTIADDHGNRVTETIEVNVTNPDPPVIHTFETTPEPPILGEFVSFTWAAEADRRVTSSLVSCTLIRNGTSRETTLPCEGGSFGIEQTDLGEFTYTFTITDSYNPPVTREHTFTVLPARPVIEGFRGTPNPVEVNKPIGFGHSSFSYYSLDVPVTCSVDPGDGTGPSTPADCSSYNPKHTYTTPGTYTATLIVTDDYNRETKFTTNVEVTESSAIDLTIYTNGLPSGAEPTIYVFRSSPYFQEIINGAGTITVPGPGTYTIQVPAGPNHEVSVPYGGDTLTYDIAWPRIEFDFTVEAGAEETVDLDFMIAPSSLQVEARGLPANFDIALPRAEATLQRLNETSGTWENIGPITTTDRFDIAPGVYQVQVEDITRTVYQGSGFTEVYVAQEPTPTAHSSGTRYDRITRQYDLQTASLTTSATGLPAGLTANFELRRIFPTNENVPAPWNTLRPGQYSLRPQPVPGGTIPLPDDLEPDDVNYASGDGLIGVVYTADLRTVRMDSNATEVIDTSYGIADGLLRVHIQRPNGAEHPVVGNVSVRKYPDGEWTTYTTEHLHRIYTEPGVYEARIEDVEPLDGVHGGYYASSYATKMLYAVPSYNHILDIGLRHITIDVRYTANSP